MTSWAKVGAKCVYVHRHNGQVTRKPLEYMGVYTIRTVVSHPYLNEIGIYLEGVVNEIHPLYGMEKGYSLSAFRPLVTRTQEQDVEMFLRLVDRVPNMEVAE